MLRFHESMIYAVSLNICLLRELYLLYVLSLLHAFSEIALIEASYIVTDNRSFGLRLPGRIISILKYRSLSASVTLI